MQPVQDRSSPGDGGNPSKFGGMEITVKVGRIRTSYPHPRSLPASHPEDPAQQGNRGSVGRLERDSGKPVQAARSGPTRSRGLDVSPRALEWQRPPGRSGDEVGRGVQGAVGSDLRALGLQELGRQCCPPGSSVGLGQTGGEGERGRRSSGEIAAASGARVGSVPSCRRRRGGSGEARLADKRGQHLGCPGELFQQAGRDRYFEWQATPFLTPGICGVPTALRRA